MCAGQTGHTEAVRVEFDTHAIKYEDLLTVFWDIIDPTASNRQGNDVGPQYRSGIYYHNDYQRVAATRSREELQKKLQQPIATEVEAVFNYFPAEDYHQQYLEKGGQCAFKGDLTPIRCYG